MKTEKLFLELNDGSRCLIDLSRENFGAKAYYVEVIITEGHKEILREKGRVLVPRDKPKEHIYNHLQAKLEYVKHILKNKFTLQRCPECRSYVEEMTQYDGVVCTNCKTYFPTLGRKTKASEMSKEMLENVEKLAECQKIEDTKEKVDEFTSKWLHLSDKEKAKRIREGKMTCKTLKKS